MLTVTLLLAWGIVQFTSTFNHAQNISASARLLSTPSEKPALANQNPSLTPYPKPTDLDVGTTDSSMLAHYEDLKLVKACTKQLMYIQGDNLGIIAADGIKALQKIVKSEMNEAFSRNADRSQILDVTVTDQLFDPQLPQDITIVTLILGSFPNIEGFVFDAEVQQMFDDVSNNILAQLKENIYQYSDFTDLFSVIDWNINATEAQCGKIMMKEDEEMNVQTTSAENLETLIQEDSKSALFTPSLILICGVIGFLVCACILAYLIQYFHNVEDENKGLEEYSDDTIARLAGLYAQKAYADWSAAGPN